MRERLRSKVRVFSVLFVSLMISMGAAMHPVLSEPAKEPDASQRTSTQPSDEKVTPAIEAFVKRMQATIKGNWHPPRIKRSVHPVATFTVHPDGQITDVSISKSSGDEEFDQACVKAILQSSPIAGASVLPKAEPVNFDFAYNYKVKRNSESLVSWLLLIPVLALLWWKLKHQFTVLLAYFVHRLPAEGVMPKPTVAIAPSGPSISAALFHDGKSQFKYWFLIVFGTWSVVSGIMDRFMWPINQFVAEWDHPMTSILIGHIWEVPERTFWIVGGTLMAFLADPMIYGYSRFAKYALSLPDNGPGKLATVTFAKHPLYPVQARIEKFDDGTHVEKKKCHMYGDVRLPNELPFTGKARVYLDPRTKEPVMIIVGNAHLFVQATGIFRKVFFCPWLMR